MMFNKLRMYIYISIISFFVMTPCFSATQSETSVLVVRGGHSYDTPEFEEMCLSLEGIKVDLVLTAHMESMTATEINQRYDAILFLNQNKHYTTYDWNRKQYMDLTRLGIGMVFLHFTLSSQPEWDEYHDLVGGKWFLKNYTEDKKLHSTYFTEMTRDIVVLDTDHPVTKNIEDFTLTDAFYGNIYIAPDVHPLLGTNHPDVSQTIAWTHQYNTSKVVYIMPGFTKDSYQNISYQKLIANALKYVGHPTE